MRDDRDDEQQHEEQRHALRVDLRPLGQKRQACIGVGQHHRFGDLEHQEIAQPGVGVEHGVEVFGVLVVAYRHARNVDGDGHLVRTVLAQPFHAFARHGDIELGDQAGLFGEGDVLVGAFLEIAVEAHQRLVVMHRAGAGIEDRMERHLEVIIAGEIAEVVQGLHGFLD